jgi:hypothetical protein
MDLKSRPNHQAHLHALRRMTPAQRLALAFALSEMTRQLPRDGLRRRFPDLSEDDLHSLFIQRLTRCHNRNY